MFISITSEPVTHRQYKYINKNKQQIENEISLQ